MPSLRLLTAAVVLTALVNAQDMPGEARLA